MNSRGINISESVSGTLFVPLATAQAGEGVSKKLIECPAVDFIRPWRILGVMEST